MTKSQANMIIGALFYILGDLAGLLRHPWFDMLWTVLGVIFFLTAALYIWSGNDSN